MSAANQAGELWASVYMDDLARSARRKTVLNAATIQRLTHLILDLEARTMHMNAYILISLFHFTLSLGMGG